MTKLGLLFILIFVSACATTPPPRKAVLEMRWIRSTLSTDYFGFRNDERTAPTLDGTYVYLGNSIDGVVALDRTSGQQAWHFPVRGGVDSGIAVEENRIYFGGSDGQFYCLQKLTGEPIWTFPTRAENLAPPLVKSGVVYFLAGNNVIYALDAKTGKQLWLYNRGEASQLSIKGGTKPAVSGNSVYVGFSDGYFVALNKSTGSLTWERRLSDNIKFTDIDASPVIEGNRIWVSSYDGALYSLSRTDGQIKWRTDAGGSVPVTIVKDTLFYPSLDHKIYALDKMSGKQKWAKEFPENFGIPTKIQPHKGLIFVGLSSGPLVALSEQNGKQKVSYDPGQGVFATPAIDKKKNLLYVFSNEANLHVLELKWTRPGPLWKWQVN